MQVPQNLSIIKEGEIISILTFCLRLSEVDSKNPFIENFSEVKGTMTRENNKVKFNVVHY